MLIFNGKDSFLTIVPNTLGDERLTSDDEVVRSLMQHDCVEHRRAGKLG